MSTSKHNDNTRSSHADTEKQTEDVFVQNHQAVAKTNAYILKWMTFIASVNMAVLAITSPLLQGFSVAHDLYLACAILCAAFCLFCFLVLDKRPLRATTPLFYLFLAALCAYATALSVHYYPDIHGVTVVAIFALIPTVILDRSWRVNSVLVVYFVAFAVIEFLFKTSSLAIDDVVTCGSLLLFGIIIGNYLRNVRIRSLDQQRILVDQRELLEYQRDRDALTGLPNRRSLFLALAQIDKSNTPLAGTIMMDIDDFKDYNDMHGHQAGDICLIRYGIFLSNFAREYDVSVYRYGGEEFLILYRTGNPRPLSELASLLVEKARNLREYPDDAEDATASAGFATQPEGGNVKCERLITMADKALYEAKRQGKNRAISYEPTTMDGFYDGEPSLRQELRS